MGQLGFQELFLIFLIALLVFGPRKLPELGKSLGKGLREFKRATNDLKSTWDEQMREVERETNELKTTVRQAERDLQADFEAASYSSPPPSIKPEEPSKPGTQPRDQQQEEAHQA